ncbi:MAG: hypothetical protein ABFD89_09900 [Bryobacteraceae bacterium]
MARVITNQGRTVKGALAAFLVPRIAQDKAIKPGELDKIFMDAKLKPAPFKVQIPVLADCVKAIFKSRLAKDADLEDLEELLEALQEGGEGNEDELEDKKGMVADEDDMSEDEGDPGSELMKCLSECNIPEEMLEKINTLITKMGSPAAEDGVHPAAKPVAKPAVTLLKKPGENAAPMKEVPVTKPALDAALAANTKAVQTHIASLFTAANDVEPIIGKVDALAFDSADSIYKMALDSAGVKTENVHPSAYKALLQLASDHPAPAFDSALAADNATAAQDFEKRYPNIPAQA